MCVCVRLLPGDFEFRFSPDIRIELFLCLTRARDSTLLAHYPKRSSKRWALPKNSGFHVNELSKLPYGIPATATREKSDRHTSWKLKTTEELKKTKRLKAYSTKLIILRLLLLPVVLSLSFIWLSLVKHARWRTRKNTLVHCTTTHTRIFRNYSALSLFGAVRLPSISRTGGTSPTTTTIGRNQHDFAERFATAYYSETRQLTKNWPRHSIDRSLCLYSAVICAKRLFFVADLRRLATVSIFWCAHWTKAKLTVSQRTEKDKR